MTSARHARGFTLLEVMLAFVLLAAAMGVLLGMLSNGLRQVRQAENETEAALYAQSLMDELGVLAPIRPGQRSGQFAGGRYRYRLDISEAEDPVPPVALPSSTPAPAEAEGGPRLYRVALLVTWGAGQRGQRLDLVTLRARADDGARP